MFELIHDIIILILKIAIWIVGIILQILWLMIVFGMPIIAIVLAITLGIPAFLFPIGITAYLVNEL